MIITAVPTSIGRFVQNACGIPVRSSLSTCMSSTIIIETLTMRYALISVCHLIFLMPCGKHIIHLKVDHSQGVDVHLLSAPAVLYLLWTHV